MRNYILHICTFRQKTVYFTYMIFISSYIHSMYIWTYTSCYIRRIYIYIYIYIFLQKHYICLHGPCMSTYTENIRQHYAKSGWPHVKARWNTRGTLWSARERALVALSAEQERHTKCVSSCLKEVREMLGKKVGASNTWAATEFLHMQHVF